MRILRLAAIFVFAHALIGQTFRGSIAGVVTDASGAAIAGAGVKLDSPSTGLSHAVATNAQGQYAFLDLPVGTYTLTVSQTGFEAKVDRVEVAVSRITNLDVQLGAAHQQQAIEVVDTKTVADLPMNGRDFRQMIKLAPGVSPASTSVNGVRTSGNNYQIDGADNNDAFQNAAAVNQGGVSGIAGTPADRSHRPVLRAEQRQRGDGRNGGSAVNFVIKSGTNDLHGRVQLLAVSCCASHYPNPLSQFDHIKLSQEPFNPFD